MTERNPVAHIEVPVNLSEFIDGIDWHDEKNKRHLKDVVAMVQEAAPEQWKTNYQEHVAWHTNKRSMHGEENRKLPKEGRDLEIREYADEYYWLESAVRTAEKEGYLSEKDEARTRLLLARAMKT
jgi:hypothetical protein